MSFDGVTGHVTVPFSATLERLGGSLTLDAWINLNHLGGVTSTIVVKSSDYALDVSGGKLRFFFVGGGTGRVLVSSSTVPLGEWVHVAGVFDAATGTATLYLNGVPDGGGALVSNQFPPQGGFGLLIGASNFFKGLLDEVEMYSHALSAEEIQAIFAAGSGGKCKSASVPPVANAGSDQTAHPGTPVTLDGTGSFDPDGNTPLTYAWHITAKPAGSAATLSDPAAAMPSFTPDLLGDYTIQLVVTDSLGTSSAPDLAQVSTSNSRPVAEAGLDQMIIQIGTTVQLDGSQSFDLDGDDITYSWSLLQKPPGSTASLSDPTLSQPTFVADVHGDYVLSLVVTDDLGAVSPPDTVLVTFENVKPVANAGVNQAVLVGQTVLLNGSGSTDANFDPLTYSWSLVSKPTNSTAALDSPTAVASSFVADLPGMYIVSLVVNDGVVDSDTSSVTITAVTVQDQLTQTLAEAMSTINALAPGVFKNQNLLNALTNKINAVLGEIDQGLYQEALDKLEHDILAKTNGCAETGAPDKNDWITDCGAQAQVYPVLIEAIELLRSLI